MAGIILQSIFLIFLLAVIVFFIQMLFNVAFRGYAPFWATRPKVLKEILAELEIKDDSIVYELGSGKAGFLRGVRKKSPKARLVGIENSLIPYLFAQIQKSLTGTKIKFWRKNFLDIDLSEANIIYCYLNQESMVSLEKKFQKECRPGTMVVSYQFLLPNITPYKKIRVHNNLDRVYFYKF